jgi:hypothetical protein
MTPDVLRVASRYQTAASGAEPTAETFVAEGVSLTVADIAKLLEPHVGRLHRIGIRPAPHEAPTGFLWDAFDAQGNKVTGRIDVRIRYEPSRITVRPDLLVDGDEDTTTRYAAALPKQLLEDRLRQIATKARRLIDMARVRPDVPAHEIAAELVEIVEMADGG